MPDQVKDISLRSIILTLRHYLVAGLRGWPWIFAGAALVTAFMVWSAYTTPVRYEARVGFVVNDSSSEGGGLGAILGQLTLGGGGGGGGANLQRIKSFVTSRQLLNDLLLTEATINDKTDLVVNHLIEINKLVELFELDPDKGTVRLSSDSLSALSLRERSLLKSVYNYLAIGQEQPLRAEIDVITDRIVVIVQTRQEALSFYLAETLFTKLTDFYTDEATTPARITVDRLQAKADSVLTELNAAEYQLASFSDTKLGLINQRDQLRRVRLSRQVTILSTAYGEIIRNLETAKFSLDAVTPYFKLVEAPFYPLDRKKTYPQQAALYGIVIGGVLGFLLAVAIQFYQDIMAEKTIYEESS